MIVPFETEADLAEAIPRVVEHLREGGLVLYPTETVFGIGGLVRPNALARLASLKGRADAKPFIILLCEPAQAPGLRWTDAARALADAFWPGPLTLVLRDMNGQFPPRVANGERGVAVRVTPHAGVRLLLDALGEPITSTSANAPGEAPAETLDEARALLDALRGGEDLWLLEGAAGGARPSTVLDCTEDRPRLVREGAVPLERIREIVDDVDA